MRPPDAVFDGPSLPGVEFLEIGGHGLRISGCRADHWISFSFVNEPHAAIEGVSLKRLDQQARQLEVWAKAPSFEAVLAEERQASPVYGGRSAFGWERDAGPRQRSSRKPVECLGMGGD